MRHSDQRPDQPFAAEACPPASRLAKVFVRDRPPDHQPGSSAEASDGTRELGHRTFKHAPATVAMARRFAIEALLSAPAETLETVALLVSELASNYVRHADSQFDLSIMLTAREIRVEATDHGGGEPTLRSPNPTDPSGRGLFIVDTLASAWGVEHRDASDKTVWFTVASDSPRPASQSAPSVNEPAS